MKRLSALMAVVLAVAGFGIAYAQTPLPPPEATVVCQRLAAPRSLPTVNTSLSSWGKAMQDRSRSIA